jgi:predicted nucleic acid-binding protein
MKLFLDTNVLIDFVLERPAFSSVKAKEEIPNAITLAAMKEIENGKDAGPVCMDNLESFIASMQ